MSFASVTFLLFFVPVYLLYWQFRGRARKGLLLASSYAFYAAWDWRFVGLLVLSTVVDYSVGSALGRNPSPRVRRALLLVSLGVNLGVLGYFKYAGFFMDSLATLLATLGWQVSLPALRLAVPVGVSFYTFRSLSYTLDIFRGQLKPARSLLDYAVFVGFFPLLGAGPIAKARDFLPQLTKDREFAAGDLDSGFTRFVLGLIKKVFIADTLGLYLVDPVFARPEAYGSGVLWLAVVGYAVQIYADFSGYSSMAIGVSKAFGFRIRENFTFPYTATSVLDFWRRWHISMTSWFREYLWWSLAKNIPFGGSIGTRLRWSRALLVVFLISGLWHGASWTFVAWGGVHGLYLVVNQQWRAWREPKRDAAGSPMRLGAIPGWLITQLLVCLAWVLFRSRDFTTAWTLLKGLAVSSGATPLVVPWLCWAAFAGFLIDHLGGYLLERQPDARARVPAPVRGFALASMIVFLWYGAPSHAGEFIYFRF